MANVDGRQKYMANVKCTIKKIPLLCSYYGSLIVIYFWCTVFMYSF